MTTNELRPDLRSALHEFTMRADTVRDVPELLGVATRSATWALAAIEEALNDGPYEPLATDVLDTAQRLPQIMSLLSLVVHELKTQLAALPDKYEIRNHNREHEHKHRHIHAATQACAQLHHTLQECAEWFTSLDNLHSIILGRRPRDNHAPHLSPVTTGPDTPLPQQLGLPANTYTTGWSGTALAANDHDLDDTSPLPAVAPRTPKSATTEPKHDPELLERLLQGLKNL